MAFILSGGAIGPDILPSGSHPDDRILPEQTRAEG
jgi:hypothetical protein